MLQDFLQVDLLGAGVWKWCTLPFIHAPPPCPVVPCPHLHTLPLCLHLGAHWIPPPHFCTPAPLVCSTLHLGCASPCLQHPSCFHHLLPRLHCPSFHLPSPCARSPCMWSSTDAWPLVHGPPLPHALLARGTLCMVLPLCTPPSLLCFQHAHKRACGCGGALKWRGKRCGPGGGDHHEWEGGRHVVTWGMGVA